MGTFFRSRPPSFGFDIRMTPAVKALLIANVALFVVTGFLGIPLDRQLFLGLTPAYALRGFVWQLFTYMFFHGDLGHILFNMLTLWMFGTTLEQTWGKRRFLRFYFTCGIGAGVTILLAAFTPWGAPWSTTIGSSGAIYGLLLAFGMMFPNVPVLVFFLFPMPAKYFVMLMGAINFYMARAGAGSGVSYIAHLGGLLVGYLYLRTLSRSYRPGRFSWAEWRVAYERWRRRRLQKKFEVYMRKHGQGPDSDEHRWIQ